MADQSPAVVSKRSPRRLLVGVVVSDKMSKTISVRVRRKVKHKKYGKYIVKSTVHKAHDERGTAKQGDKVEIAFARRLSKTKHWTLVRVVEAARVVAVTGQEEVAAAIATTPAVVAPTPPKAPKAPTTTPPAAQAPKPSEETPS